MKHYLTILLLLTLLPVALFAQQLTNKQIENDLNKRYERIISFPYGGGNDIDSLDLCDNLFREKMAFYTSHYPATLNWPFKELQKDRKVTITTSEDGLFRIYSWDTWDGGTMHSFSNVFQFKAGDKVYSKLSADTGTDQNFDPGVSYFKIYTLSGNHKTYYMAFGRGAYSSMVGGTRIKIFEIENNRLNDTVKLIQNKKGKMINSLESEYSIGFHYPGDRIPASVHYDNAKQLLFVPVSTPEDSVTGEYQVYHFTGKSIKYQENIKPNN